MATESRGIFVEMLPEESIVTAISKIKSQIGFLWQENIYELDKKKYVFASVSAINGQHYALIQKYSSILRNRDVIAGVAINRTITDVFVRTTLIPIRRLVDND